MRADLVVIDTLIRSIAPAGSVIDTALPVVAMNGGMVFPCFSDMHTHLDKGHIWPRRPNPDGSYDSARAAVRQDRQIWSVADLAARMDFALRSAYAHGTHLVRTHLDCHAENLHAVFSAFSEIKERWHGRIALQAVAMFPVTEIENEPFFQEVLRQARHHDAQLGCVTEPGPLLAGRLARLMCAASDGGHDLDLHVDETSDPSINTLSVLASAARETAFEGRIVAGHCCSLALQDEETARRTIDAVAEAEIAIVSLPMCNLYLQDRSFARTPRWRGVTLLRELAAAGVKCAVASDNTRDPFFAYGDLDPLEVLREAVRIMHLDHPLDGAAGLVTREPADICRAPLKSRLFAGGTADMVLFKARNWSELLARPQSDRLVLRNGRLSDARVPDYAELDHIFSKAEND